MSDTTGSEDVQRLLERAAAAGPSDASFNAFTRIVLSGADATAREGVPDDVLVETLQRAFEGHAQKPAGGHRSAVSRMHATTAGGSYLSLVLLVNDDMPFIVDSVIGELQARGHMPLLVLHPILKTERNGAGMRERIVGAGDANWADGMQESIFAAVIDEISDAAASELAGALDSVLRDVRSAVADWRPMVSCLEGVVRQFERAPPQIAPGVLSETLEFCRWLIDGQFTFLGMRAYRLVGDAGSGTLEPVEDSGFGVLRDPGVPVLSKGGKPLEITPEIRRQLFAPHPLLITKSDMRSRVHRHAYMDYVGLKTYGADGRQNGELRMVGLFTSQAYTERPGAIPLLRQKVEAVLRRTGYAPGSHDGKMILNVIEHFPRDELFQIRDDMLAEWARAILDLDLRPRVRLLIRRDGFDRFVSALVYVPRERFSTQIRAQIGDALARGAGGHVSAFTPFFPEAALIRVH